MSHLSRQNFVAERPELVLKAAVRQYFVHLYQYLKRTLHYVTLSCLLTYADVC